MPNATIIPVLLRPLNDTQHRFKHNEFPLLVTTKAYGMGIDHRGLRFIVHYGMPSSLESYYQEIGRAGRDDSQAHCALLVRLPHATCLERYVDKQITYESFENAADNEILPPCLTSAARTSRRCPPEIGLPEPCDLSRQLLLMMQTYVKPEGFANQAAEAWKTLLDGECAEDGSIRHRVCGGGKGGDSRLMAHHNYLYRMRQVGLVRDFRIEYVPHGDHFDNRFHVWLAQKRSVGDILKQLALRICSMRRSAGSVSSLRSLQAINELEHELRSSMPTNVADSTEFVAWAIRRLFAAVRAHVIKMRMESFAHLLRYVRSDNNCRRRELVGGMTGDGVGSDDHYCGFCDSRSCVPDLGFPKGRARTAECTSQFRDLCGNAIATFDTDDVETLQRIIREAERRNCVGALGYQATAHLASFPDSPAATLLAAEAYATNPDETLRHSAHRYFRAYARITNVELKDNSKADSGYQSYARYDTTEAIKSYAVAGSVFDDKERISKLAADAAQAALEHAEVDNLRFAAVQSQVRALTNGLDSVMAELDSVLK